MPLIPLSRDNRTPGAIRTSKLKPLVRRPTDPSEKDISEQETKRKEKLRKLKAQFEADVRAAEFQERSDTPRLLKETFRGLLGGAREEIRKGADITLQRMRGETPEERTKIAEIFTPGRGFTEQELREAEPTIKEKLVAPVKFAGEISQIVPAVGDIFVEKITGKKPEETPFTRLAQFSEPKTAGEAKAMRHLDLADILSGTGIARTKALSKQAGDVIQELAIRGDGDVVRNVIDDMVGGKMSQKTRANLLDTYGELYTNKVDEVIQGKKITDEATKAIPIEDQRNMNDVIQYITGENKLKGDAAVQTEILMAELQQKYGLPDRKKIETIATDFGKILDRQGFEPFRPGDEFRTLTKVAARETPKLKPVPTRDAQGRFTGSKVVKKQPAETMGAFAGFEIDEEGNMKFDPTKAIAGVAGFHVAKKPASKIKAGIQDSKTFKQASSWIANKFVKSQKVFQDELIDLKKLQDEGKLQGQGPYEAEKLYHGRVDTRIQKVKDEVEGIITKIVKSETKDLKDKVNRYLVAKHAPERNKAIGEKAAGISTERANKLVAEIESSPDFKEIQETAKKITDLNNRTLEVMKEGHLITPELFDDLRNKYKNHVPLQRVLKTDEDLDKLLAGGKGFSVKTSGLFRAKGSELEVADILDNVTANLNEAIIRAEKNRVSLSLSEFIDNNPDVGMFERIKPKAIGETFDGKPILQQPKGKDIIQYFEDGKKKYIRVADHKFAEIWQGLGNNHIPSILRVIGAYTRFRAGMATRYNLGFGFPNLVRDSQEMAVYLTSQKDIGLTGAAKTFTRIGEAGKAVADHIFKRDTEGARLYQQMLEDGGSTGGISLANRKQIEANAKMIEKMAKSPTRKGVHKILKGIDNWNRLFEDSTRFASYKTALERGLSREEAAVIAKDATINFNKKGTAGSLINSMYMFANASIQGSAKMLKAMKNPKVASAVVTSVTTATWTLNKWNDTVDPEWRNKVTEWDKKSNQVILIPGGEEEPTYLTIPVSWGLKPLKVMADFSYEAVSGIETDPAKVAAGIFAAVLDGYNPLGGHDFTSAITPTFLDIPADIKANKAWHGGDIRPKFQEGLPKAEQVFRSTKNELIGGKVTEYLQKLSEMTKRKIDLSPEDVLYVSAQMLSGTGTFLSKAAHTVSAVGGNEDLQLKKVPFVGRFVKDTSAERIAMSQKYRNRDEFLEGVKEFKTGSDEQKDFIREYLKSLPDDEERNSIMFVLADGGIDTKGIKRTKELLDIETVWDQVKLFLEAGDEQSANQIVNSLSEEEYEAYEKYKKSYKSANTREFKSLLGENPEEAVKFIRSIEIEQERARILNNLDDEEWKVFETAKNNLDQ